ncbi:MAG: glycosyltransferase family A protein [Anaerohalosphaeraceae bacterium]
MTPGAGSVSILIPVFEPLYLIDDCLNSLLSYTDADGIDMIKEIVIIDNSKSGAWPVAAKYGSLMSIRRIAMLYQRPGKNLLHVESINMALSMSKGEWILLFNDDIEIPKTQGDWLSRQARMFRDITKCGIATITLLHRDHTIYWIGNDANSQHIDLGKPYDFIPRGYYLKSPWSNIANALVRRETFKKVPYDGIDPKTKQLNPHYVADHFFGRKVKALGMENAVCRDTWIYHHNERLRPENKKKGK